MKIALIVASEFKDYKLLEMKLDELKVSEVISGTSNGYEMLEEYVKTRSNVKISLANGSTSHVSIAYNAINEAENVVIFANGDGKRTELAIANALNEKKNLKIYSYKSNAFNIKQQNEYLNISMCGNLQKASKIESICLNKEEVEELINKLTKIENKKKKNFPKSLSLYNIASWFISDEYIEKKAKEELGEYSYIDAGIPILQRNWVWGANKIITFGDSLYRGIPVGSVILNKKNGEHKIRRGRMADNNKKENIKTITHELLDGQQRTTAIATAFSDPWHGDFSGNPPAMLWVSLDKNKQLKFYLTTKQHPWGFDKNNKRLTPNARKEAIEILFGNLQYKDYSQSKAYPYICIENKEQVYPVCKIIKHINGADSETNLEEYIKGIQGEINIQDYEIIKEKIEKILNNYELPCVISEISGDDIELAFTRLNTQGEVLDGEELRYSIIKAKWEKAEIFITQVEEESKLFPASRTIITYLRLVESLKQTANNKLPPYRDNLDDFKKNINIEDLENNFDFGINVFKKLNSLIRYSNDKDFKLSAPLINFLGNDTKNRDIIFIFLYWLSKIKNDTLSVEQEKIALGALTLMSWFSSSPSKIIEKLWNKINEIKDDIGAIKDFWANYFYDIAFENNKSKEIEIYPAVSPNKLKEIIDDTFIFEKSKEFYLQTNMYYLNDFGNNPSKKVFDIFSQNELLSKIFWWQTINNIIRSNMNHPYLAYYFQRHYMDKEFADFDPTLTTKQNDIQRPWDIDHIIPQNKISQSSKCLYKFWIHSVGNFCAMDYSRNRSKSDKNINLDDIKIYEELQLNNNNGMELFIDYLSKEDITETQIENIENYPFVVPIVKRLILMYSHWYDELMIEKLVTK